MNVTLHQQVSMLCLVISDSVFYLSNERNTTFAVKTWNIITFFSKTQIALFIFIIIWRFLFYAISLSPFFLSFFFCIWTFPTRLMIGSTNSLPQTNWFLNLFLKVSTSRLFVKKLKSTYLFCFKNCSDFSLLTDLIIFVNCRPSASN